VNATNDPARADVEARRKALDRESATHRKKAAARHADDDPPSDRFYTQYKLTDEQVAANIAAARRLKALHGGVVPLHVMEDHFGPPAEGRRAKTDRRWRGAWGSAASRPKGGG
jgi:hypothetical protein